MKVRINEQRLHVTAIEQHETNRPIGFVDSEIEWSIRKERRHFNVDITAIFGAEKVVRGVHCPTPDFHDSAAIRGGGFPYFNHELRSVRVRAERVQDDAIQDG